MELTAAEIWNRLLNQAKNDLPEQTVRVWLDSAQPLRVEGDKLVMGTPDQLAADWNEMKHATILAEY
ncbi:MAG: DnaA N-terminal domain-containing protein, partial [Gemmatimonadaceae bacterium]